MTFNEPVSSYIGAGYVAGIFPPGFILTGFEVKDVLHNLIEAHVKAYDRITELDNLDSDSDGVSKMVSFTHYMFAVKPLGTTDDSTRASRNFEYFMNDYFLNAVVNGEGVINHLNTLQRHNTNSPNFKIHGDWKNKEGFIAPQYYRLAQVYHSVPIALRISYFGGGFDNDDKKFDGYRNDMGWPIYPEGIYQILMKIKNNWDKPIIITENGVADANDQIRAPFIASHLQQVKKLWTMELTLLDIYTGQYQIILSGRIIMNQDRHLVYFL